MFTLSVQACLSKYLGYIWCIQHCIRFCFSLCVCCFFSSFNFITELEHDKTYNKTCVTSKGSDQPVHPPSLAKTLVYPSLDSLKAHASSEDSNQTAHMHRLI